MVINPIVGMIHNVKLNRWHPVYFSENPPPSGNDPGHAMRYKSGAHHTEGFATREEGVEGAKDLAERLKPHSLGKVRTALGGDFPWDGEDVPAMVVFFSVDDETATPLF